LLYELDTAKCDKVFNIDISKYTIRIFFLQVVFSEP